MTVNSDNGVLTYSNYKGNGSKNILTKKIHEEFKNTECLYYKNQDGDSLVKTLTLMKY